jgi:hypothetical protein
MLPRQNSPKAEEQHSRIEIEAKNT